MIVTSWGLLLLGYTLCLHNCCCTASKIATNIHHQNLIVSFSDLVPTTTTGFTFVNNINLHNRSTLAKFIELHENQSIGHSRPRRYIHFPNTVSTYIVEANTQRLSKNTRIQSRSMGYNNLRHDQTPSHQSWRQHKSSYWRYSNGPSHFGHQIFENFPSRQQQVKSAMSHRTPRLIFRDENLSLGQNYFQTNQLWDAEEDLQGDISITKYSNLCESLCFYMYETDIFLKFGT